MALATTARAGTWTADKIHSTIGFEVEHMVSTFRGRFEEYDAQVLGISVDGVWCHSAFRDARKIRFPLLADFEPKGDVSRRYGAYRDKDGFSERALFVIDAQGIVRWSYLSPVGVNPGADGIFAALDELTPQQRGQQADATAARGRHE